MKIEPIYARAGSRKLWLGCTWQLRSSKHYVFNARFAAWRILRAKKARPSEWRR